MNASSTTHRRGFLGRVLGAAAAAGFSIGRTESAFAQASGPDDWIKEVKGTHRTLFDFPQHKILLSSAAHPQLHQHIHAGLQSRRWDGGHRRDLLRDWKPVEHFSRLQRCDVGQVRAGRVSRVEGRVGQVLHPERVQQGDERRCASRVPGAAGADDSGIRGFHAADGHREPAEDGNEVHSVQQRARGAGVWSWRPAARGRWPTFSRT